MIAQLQFQIFNQPVHFGCFFALLLDAECDIGSASTRIGVMHFLNLYLVYFMLLYQQAFKMITQTNFIQNLKISFQGVFSFKTFLNSEKKVPSAEHSQILSYLAFIQVLVLKPVTVQILQTIKMSYSDHQGKEPVKQNIKANLNDLKQNIKQNLKDMRDKTRDNVSDINKTAKEGFRDMKDNIKVNMNESMQSYASTAKQAVKQTAEQLKDNLASAKDNIKSTINNTQTLRVIKAQPQRFFMRPGFLGLMFLGVGGAYYYWNNMRKPAIPSMKTQMAAKSYLDASNRLADDFRREGRTAIAENIRLQGKSTGETVIDNLKRQGSEAFHATKGAMSQAKKQGKEIYNNVSKTANEVLKQGQKAVNQVSRAASDLKTDIKKEGKHALNSVNKTVNGVLIEGEAKIEKGKNIAKDVKDKVEEIASEFKKK